MTCLSKTLIIQPLAGIGDYMWFIRHVQAIARATPEKKVTLLMRRSSQANVLSRYDPYIEQVLWLDIKPGEHDGIGGTHRLATMLKPFGFRTAWILHSRSVRYGVACRLAGIREIHGIGAGWQRPLITSRRQALDAQALKEHPIARAGQLLKNHGLTLADRPAPIIIPPLILQEVMTRLADFPKPWAALIIGSSEVEKKWPAPSYAALGKKILQARGGSLFVIGGSSEKFEGESIEKKVREQSPHVRSISEDLWFAMGLLSLCDFAVGNDTGLLHGMPMVGGRGLVLMGHSMVSIHLYVPLEGVQLLPPPGTKRPPLSQNNMRDLPVDLVFEKLRDLGWIG